MGKEAEIIKAAKTGDIRTLERHLNQSTKRSSMIGNIKKHIHPNIQDELGYTLLHHATLNGHRETVTFLLRNGASTTIPDSSGSYPLHLASWKGDIEIVRLLTTLGPSRANVDQQSNTEDTALHLAAQYGYCGVVEFLLERHANPMMKNIRGETPLDLAAQFGYIDTVHVLISHCPEILRLSRPEFSPLHLAARNGHSVVVLSLINAGIPINMICKSGTALHEAAICGKENTVKLLLDKGIDVNLKDSEGRTVLQILSDFSTDKYIQIKTLIQNYQDGGVLPTGRYMKPTRQQLVAVPRKDSKPSQTDTGSDLPQLQYRQDEKIVIIGRQTHKIYIGSIHGITGTFPVKETRLYQEISGKLHRIYPRDIVESQEDGSLHVLQQVQTGDMQERKSMRESRTEQSFGGRTSRSLSTSDTVPEKDKAIERKKKSKLSDKEKKFILSKDTGAYSQLAPVNAPSPEAVEVREVVPPPQADGEKKGYIGSYYLLEVGNFETASPQIPSTYPEEKIPPPPSHSPPHLPPEKLRGRQLGIPQYENVKLRSMSSVEMEKPRSISDGSLLQTPLSSAIEKDQKRSKSFQSHYENFQLKTPPSPSPDTPPSNPTPPPPCISPQSPYPQDTIDRRGPMPLPPEEVEPSVISQLAASHRTDYNHVATATGGVNFKISSETDDVMVSSMNPNYSEVVFQRGTRPETRGSRPSSDKEKSSGAVSDPSVLIISQDMNPFAGLVQSSSFSDRPADDGGGYVDLPSSPRHRLKSVWDERRVNQEWNKIDDFLKDMTIDIVQEESALMGETPPNIRTPSPEEEKSNVFLWLSGMGLQGYTSTFESNGFDQIKFMGGGILDIDDLKNMGIYDSDQGTIMIKVAILSPPPRLSNVSSVEEWLTELHLSHLTSYFEGFSLEKISQLWEIQLSTVLGIELLGYQKRLLYGINELKKRHPEWAPNSLKTSKELPRGPMADVDFARDYSKIRSLRNTCNELDVFTDTDGGGSAPVQWTQSKLVSQATVPSHKSDVTDQKLPTASVQSNSADESLPNVSPPTDHSPSKVPVRGAEYATVTSSSSSAAKSDASVAFTPPSTESKNYQTGYLGSALVKGLAGKHSAEEACLKLRTQTDGIAKIPQIILSISWKGVKFVDADSKIVVSTHLIRDISHCCPDIEDPRVFAYMTKDKDTNCSYCHVFMVPSKEMADEIIMTVGQAFEVAYQAVVRARSKYKSPTTSPKKVSKTSALKRSFRKLRSSSQDVDDNGVK